MTLARVILSISALLLAQMPTRADFVETTWHVVGFTGEAWFIEPRQVIGQTQTFYKGFAEGVFYDCDYAGQSMSYTVYAADDFFANPEFTLFRSVEDGIRLSSDRVFVHRITCAGDSSGSRRVLYPFVTNEARASAWYLFEGGVFSLFAPQ